MGTLELRITAVKPGANRELVWGTGISSLGSVCLKLWSFADANAIMSCSVLPVSLGEQTEPRFELRCSSDVIHIRTCSDSCAALMNLIQYVASYGDLLPPTGQDARTCSAPQRPKVNKTQ